MLSVLVRRLRRDGQLYLMLLPVAAGFLVFHYLPLAGVVVAFKQTDLTAGLFSGPWVGLENFRDFVCGRYFGRIVRNTFLLGFYVFAWGSLAPIVLALSLNEVRNRPFKRICQSITYLPYFLSTVVVVAILFELLGHDGVINALLAKVIGRRVEFVGTGSWFRTLFVLSHVWQTVGWFSIIYLATLSTIDPQLYEAATVDGANRWQQMRHVTLPGLLPTITLLLILNAGGLMRLGFEKVYLMYNPGIYEVADVFVTYVYRSGIVGGDYSYAAAAGLFESLMCVTFLVLTNFIARKTTGEGAW